MRFCAAISRCWCELSITISRYLSKAISINAIGSRNDLEEITYKFFGWSERWRVEKLCRLINGEAKAIHEKWSAERVGANEEKRSEQRKENAGKNGSERGRVNHDKKRTPSRQKQKKREGATLKWTKVERAYTPNRWYTHDVHLTVYFLSYFWHLPQYEPFRV